MLSVKLWTPGLRSIVAASLFMAGTAWAEAPTVAEVQEDSCQTCHGAGGMGNELVEAPRLAGMEPWYLERQLRLFRQGIRGTHPEDLQGQEMQAVAAALRQDSIADIVSRVQSWEAAPAPAMLEADQEEGGRLYQSCAACHGEAGQGNRAMDAPSLAGQSDWYLVTQLENFRAGYRGSHPEDTTGARMMTMARALPGPEAIRDVVAYINTLATE